MDGKNETMTKKRGRGRPRKPDNRMDYAIRFMVTEDHLHMKEALEDELGTNGGEVMREALELLYNMKIGWRR